MIDEAVCIAIRLLCYLACHYDVLQTESMDEINR